MKTIFKQSEKTRRQTSGYFDIVRSGKLDPSGIVKGWAIYNAAKLLKKHGATNFYIDCGGDIQTSGRNRQGEKWRVGVRNPFNRSEIVKAIQIDKEGVATSGTYIRGQHIYNPRSNTSEISGVVSITVIGPNVFDADRMATAAFAMGDQGVNFIESLTGYEAYQISGDAKATFTSGFGRYVIQ